MGDGDSGITIPGWAGKASLGILQAITLTALFATITWAWNSEKRISALETKLAAVQVTIATHTAKLEVVDKHETEIEVLKTELKYIREGVDDVKELVK